MSGYRVDRGRSDVYAAELAAFEGTSYESVTSFERLVALGDALTSSEWWTAGPVHVRRAREGAESSSARRRGGEVPVIRLADPQMTPATITHELAHVLAGLGDGHGPLFRRAHVDIVAAVLGTEEAQWLADAYADYGLSMGARQWPPPPSPVRRVALGAAAD